MGAVSMLEDIRERFDSFSYSYKTNNNSEHHAHSHKKVNKKDINLIKLEIIKETCNRHSKEINEVLDKYSKKYNTWASQFDNLKQLNIILNRFNTISPTNNNWKSLKRTKKELDNFFKERKIYGLLNRDIVTDIESHVTKIFKSIDNLEKEIEELNKYCKAYIIQDYIDYINKVKSIINYNINKDQRATYKNVINKLNKFTEIYAEFLLSSTYRPKLRFIDRLMLNKDQETIVSKKYTDYYRIQGTSGSGKTIILIHKALKKSFEHPNNIIRIFTINRSLSELIRSSIISIHGNIPDNLFVHSTYDFFISCLTLFEPQSHYRLRDPISNERVAETWCEFCAHPQCIMSKDEGIKLKSYIQRRNALINVNQYVFEEVIYILTGFSKSERKKYYDEERKSRSIPLAYQFRQVMLNIVLEWEEWLEYGNLCDPYKLTSDVINYFVDNEYLSIIRRNFATNYILIDEDQDFSTLELKALKKLIGDNELSGEKIFFVGDINQKIYSKHYKPSSVNLYFRGKSSLLKKNYRNTIQILRFAYRLIKNFPPQEDEKIFEIFDPEYSSHTGNNPTIIDVNRLNLFNFIKELIKYRMTASIGIASPSKETVYFLKNSFLQADVPFKELISNIDLDIHDFRLSDFNSSMIYLSDLEAIKGFEFDIVVICDITKDIFPFHGTPEGEYWRSASVLYTAMTRARDELFITYSGEKSVLLNNLYGHDMHIPQSSLTNRRESWIYKIRSLFSKTTSMLTI